VQNEKDLKILKIRIDHVGDFENDSLKNMKFFIISLVLELHNKKGL